MGLMNNQIFFLLDDLADSITKSDQTALRIGHFVPHKMTKKKDTVEDFRFCDSLSWYESCIRETQS